MTTSPLPRSAQRRAELQAQHDTIMAEIEERERSLRLVLAEIAGLDFAIEEAGEGERSCDLSPALQASLAADDAARAAPLLPPMAAEMDKAMQQGADAFAAGVDIHNPPALPGSLLAAWDRGWTRAAAAARKVPKQPLAAE